MTSKDVRELVVKMRNTNWDSFAIGSLYRDVFDSFYTFTLLIKDDEYKKRIKDAGYEYLYYSYNDSISCYKVEDANQVKWFSFWKDAAEWAESKMEKWSAVIGSMTLAEVKETLDALGVDHSMTQYDQQWLSGLLYGVAKERGLLSAENRVKLPKEKEDGN